ncbi:MAG: protein kinase [Terrimicrobiaceae bacterium]|nr:protein kinase [Terrimicrobiaceae bacterium]
MAIELFLDHRSRLVFRIDERIRGASGNFYEITERIACGGNGVVHQCVDLVSGDELAIKFQLSNDSKRRTRFDREIELLKQIKHDQLISYIDDGEIAASIHDSGRNKGTGLIPYVVMPLAESNLFNVLRRDSMRPRYEEYIGQFKGLAKALSVLHERAIHRDIKPENILVKGETWILSDFGLCKFNESGGELTDEDEPVGPRLWMAPEGINRILGNADTISKQSDVYQLCSIFWFIVTGRHPSGCLCRDDWTGPENLFQLLFDALSHNAAKRPMDGARLVEMLEEATLPPA